MSDRDMAAILYPSMAQEPPAEQKPPPASATEAAKKSIAECLYPSMEAEPAADPKTPATKAADQQATKPQVQQRQDPKSPEHVDRVAEVIARDLNLDPAHELTGEFAKTAAELGLSVDQTKKLTGLHAKHSETYWQKTWDGWRAEAMKLPEADRTAASQFVRRYADDDLIALLDNYGIGDHPAVVRFMARASKGK